jgi:hypothetical protein
MGILTVGACVSATAQASFLPENDLYLQDSLTKKSPTGITQDQFNAAITKANGIFTPLISALGGRLDIRGNWTDATVNASATQSFGTWVVNMYGGLARRQEVTADGFAMVLCHEIGHHLGGFPFVSSWGADEGQADYFATSHCARLLWGSEPEVNAQSRDTIEAYPKSLCDDVYQTEDAQNLCYREMLAGKSLANLLGALGGDSVAYDTPDTSVVSRTDHNHPAAQCRLDTYMAAALCSQTWDSSVIPGKRNGTGRNDAQAEGESAQYYCASRDQWSHGTRPTCWFHPGI